MTDNIRKSQYQSVNVRISPYFSVTLSSPLPAFRFFRDKMHNFSVFFLDKSCFVMYTYRT